ncbi:PAS domain-containing protein [Glaciecola siphonariae]|uniref:PAS domain-containing protein n=1 Tax=Glaciecola siphonariae TaxID=521012 RepID=A0ABV9LT65_9ALTE
MEFRSKFQRFGFKALTLAVLVTQSHHVFAFSDYVREQGPEHIATLLYFLFGVLTLLLIMPLVQFYFAELRAQANKQEREQNERVLDAIKTGVVHVNVSGVVTYANEAAARLLNKDKKSQLLSSKLADNFTKDGKAAVNKALGSKKSGQTVKADVATSKSASSTSNNKALVVEFGESFEQDDTTTRIIFLNGEGVFTLESLDVKHNEVLVAKQAPSPTPVVPQAAAVKEASKAKPEQAAPAKMNDKESKNVSGVASAENSEELSRALAQAQAYIKKLLELSPVAIGTINADHQILSANRLMTERLKFTEKELKKGNIYKLFSNPEEAGTTAKHLNKRGELKDFHVKLKGADGKNYPGELTVDLIDEEKQEYLFWIIDRADEQFQRDKFENLLQHSTMPMAILTEDGFSKLNQSACDFFNCEDERELFGYTPFSEQFNVSEQASNELAELVNATKQKGTVQSMSWTHKLQGQEVPCEITFAPIYKDQAFDSILCMWTDFRELNKVNKALTQANKLFQFAGGKLEEKQHLLDEQKLELEETTSELNRTTLDLTKVQEDLVSTQTEFTELKQDYETSVKSVEELEKELNTSCELLEGAEKANNDLMAQLESAKGEAEELEKARQTIAEQLIKSEESYQAARDELLASEKQGNALAAEKQSQDEALQGLLEQVGLMQKEIQAKDDEIAKVNAQIAGLESDYLQATESADALSAQLESLKQDTEKAKQEQQALLEKDSEVQTALESKNADLKKLEDAIADLEKKSKQEHENMLAEQAQLKAELEQTMSKLSDSEKRLEDAQAMSEKEKQDKGQYNEMLDALQKEIETVKADADKQKEALSESENDWLTEQAQIEEQRNELQSALENAEKRNESLKQELEAQLNAFKKAESEVQQNVAKQAQLQEQFDAAQQEISTLQQSIAAKEKEEQALTQQLKEKQSLEDKEQSLIKDAEENQAALAQQLAELEQQYQQSKESLEKEQSSQELLKVKLDTLEQSLINKEQELSAKAEELENAALELSQTKAQLEEQAAQLLAQESTNDPTVRPDIEKLPLPDRPELWFDIRLYLQSQPQVGSLLASLTQLIEDIDEQIKQAEEAIATNSIPRIMAASSNLVELAKTINSAPLIELTQSVENDCRDGMVDNVSIRWPSTKVALQRSLRAVYEHLNNNR